jgi:hypothetical protein
MFALNNSNAIEDANFVNSRQIDITSKGEKIDGGINLATLDSETLNKLMELQEKLSETVKNDE